MADFILREIHSEDLDAVVRIHRASFQDRALTQLGLGAVKRYYAWLLTGFSKIYPICAAAPTGDLAGFCFAGVYGGSFSGFLQRNKWYLAGRILLQPWLLFNPLVREQTSLAFRTLRHLFKKRRKPQKQSTDHVPVPREKPSSLGILSIAVAPAYQRQGVGELLIKEVESKAREKGYPQLHLTVHPENLSAVKFYQKLGWQKMPSEENWSGSMIKTLS